VDTAKAQAYFERALAVARARGAPCSLRYEVPRILPAVGFDTRDLKEAKALLGELAPHREYRRFFGRHAIASVVGASKDELTLGFSTLGG
jgi:hypothetical protein